jgi:hypothetical protein
VDLGIEPSHLARGEGDFATLAARGDEAGGNAQVKNRATGQTLDIRVDCLTVLGNIAVVSGIAWSATGPGNTDGDGAIFAVEDNGQGANATPDLVTYAYTGSGLVCTDFHSPADVNPSLFYAVEGGNIQIH